MSRFAELEQRFDALQPRERALASVTAAVLAALAVYVVWIEPAREREAERVEAIAALAPQVDAARDALARIEKELADDPEAARRSVLEQLRGEAAALDQRLRGEPSALIAPARMPVVLRELMGRDARLAVVGVEALPPQVLRWRPDGAPASGADATAADTAAPPAVPAGPAAGDAGAVPALYRHRVVLRFEGDYAGTVDYLRALEGLPLRVRPERLVVDAAQWPRLRIQLEVETLGLEEGWIGV